MKLFSQRPPRKLTDEEKHQRLLLFYDDIIAAALYMQARSTLFRWVRAAVVIVFTAITAILATSDKATSVWKAVTRSEQHEQTPPK